MKISQRKGLHNLSAISFPSQCITKHEKLQQACVQSCPLSRLTDLAGAPVCLRSCGSKCQLHAPPAHPHILLLFASQLACCISISQEHPVKESLWTPFFPLLICHALLSCCSLHHLTPPLLCLHKIFICQLLQLAVFPFFLHHLFPCCRY